MGLKIGALASQHIAVGVVEGNRIVGPVRVFPESGNTSDYLGEMPAEEIAERIRRQIDLAREGEQIDAVGIGFPGIIRNGVVEESPNLPQMKGQNLGAALRTLLDQAGIGTPVSIFNDADAMAAGIAAERGHLDKLVRVWFLGSGIGYGRYPNTGGVEEGGHTVVTLDPKENLCKCGGLGHLEGVMGHRAMRLRFLDMEPEEVFEHAKSGDARCVAFVELWHRALAAATATSIHFEGPGKFYVSGPGARFVQTEMLKLYLREMVKMSPLQGSAIEVITTSDEIAIVGAAVSAAQAVSA
ncbi:MAG TPA: ROK family protein [Blastocatellia bacterium]|nr:ROK family protein [Blastocatellia bacterium]